MHQVPVHQLVVQAAKPVGIRRLAMWMVPSATKRKYIMKIHCKQCGSIIMVNGLGRKRLNIPLKNVCEALESHRSLPAAAQELNCSEAYIYSALKANGLILKDFLPYEQKR